MQTGKFITIEGIEGVGKSTNLAFAESIIIDAGKDVVVTREPGGTPLAEDIRQLLLDVKQTSMSSDTELLLMFAARAPVARETMLVMIGGLSPVPVTYTAMVHTMAAAMSCRFATRLVASNSAPT